MWWMGWVSVAHLQRRNPAVKEETWLETVGDQESHINNCQQPAAPPYPYLLQIIGDEGG